MIKFHIVDKGTLYSGSPDLTHPVAPEVLWIDICSPTKGEEAELERLFPGFRVVSQRCVTGGAGIG